MRVPTMPGGAQGCDISDEEVVGQFRVVVGSFAVTPADRFSAWSRNLERPCVAFSRHFMDTDGWLEGDYVVTDPAPGSMFVPGGSLL